MKKFISFYFISLVTFVPQLHSIPFAEFIQQHYLPLIVRGELYLDHYKLTDITGLNKYIRNIPEHTSIVRVRLQYNQLKTLPADTFSGLYNLTEIFLLENQLQTFPKNLFNGLPELNLLVLCCNHLRELPDTIFNGLDNLHTLALGKNQLQTLSTNLFNGLRNLKRLHLQDNQLRTLPANIFNDLHSLKELKLSNNQLQRLPDTIFNNLDNLQKLDLRNNPFDPDFIPTLTNMILRMPNLKELNGKPIYTLKQLTTKKIAQNIDKYHHRLHELPSELLDLLPLTQ